MHVAIYHDLPSGGAKRTAYEIARRLAQRHELSVFTLSTANHDFCDLRPIVQHHSIIEFTPHPLFKRPWGRFNQAQRWRTLRDLDRISRKIARDIDESKPEVIFVHPSMWSQAPSILKYVQTSTAYYVQEPLRLLHEPAIARPYQNRGWRAAVDSLDPLIWLYHRQLLAMDFHNTICANRLLTNSHFTAGNVARLYKRQATVCYLGIDASRFRPLTNVKSGNFVLSVGALRPNKGFDFLIDSLATIPARVRPSLRIVANADDPLERQFLSKYARDNDVNASIEIGVSEDELIERYNQAALVAYAPVSEPFGLVPLEAMACGTPVVGINEGGVSETILDGVTGCLAPRDATTFGRTIQLLLQDGALSEQYGQRAREYILATWGWDQSVVRMDESLKQIANLS